MPRDLPIGNERLLILFDEDYTLRDLYYPNVGKENHAGGYPFRFGLFVEKDENASDDSGLSRAGTAADDGEPTQHTSRGGEALEVRPCSGEHPCQTVSHQCGIDIAGA